MGLLLVQNDSFWFEEFSCHLFQNCSCNLQIIYTQFFGSLLQRLDSLWDVEEACGELEVDVGYM